MALVSPFGVISFDIRVADQVKSSYHISSNNIENHRSFRRDKKNEDHVNAEVCVGVSAGWQPQLQDTEIIIAISKVATLEEDGCSGGMSPFLF